MVMRLQVESLGKHAFLGRDGTAVELLDLCDCLRQRGARVLEADSEDEQ
jgi:hypothetical protein